MGRSFFTIGVVLFLAGGVSRQPFVSYLGAMLLAASAIFWVYSKLALDNVIYQRKFDQRWAFFGETVELTIEIRNRKPLPIWLKCEDEVPEKLGFPQGSIQPYFKYERALLINELFVGAYEKITRKFQILCSSRGSFCLGPLTLSSKDPMGLYEVSRESQACDVLTVFPRYVPVDKKFLRILSPFGDYYEKSWLYQDPGIFKATRQYVPGDPVKFIHWKNFARTGILETKTYESSFGPKMVLCLNLSTSDYVWEGVNEEMFESLITVGASLTVALSQKGFSLGLASNGISKGVPEDSRGFPAVIPPSASGAGYREGHVRHILSCLAGMTYMTFEGFRSACQKPWVMSGNVLPIIVTGILNEEVLGLLYDLKRSKRSSSSWKNGALLVFLKLDEEDQSYTEIEKNDFLAEAKNLSWRILTARLPGGWLKAENLEVEEVVQR